MKSRKLHIACNTPHSPTAEVQACSVASVKDSLSNYLYRNPRQELGQALRSDKGVSCGAKHRTAQRLKWRGFGPRLKDSVESVQYPVVAAVILAPILCEEYQDECDWQPSHDFSGYEDAMNLTRTWTSRSRLRPI